MSEHSLHEDIIVLSIQRREQSFHILYRHQSSMHYYPIRRLQNPRKSHQSLFIFTTHTPKNHTFFFLMFKLKFEAYIFPKFNTEPQLNRRIVKLFSHIELTLTTLFKLLLSFLSTIFSGTKHGIRKNKENNFQRESENLATFVSGLGRRAFESSFQSFDWFRPATDQKSKFSYFFGISQFTL